MRSLTADTVYFGDGVLVGMIPTNDYSFPFILVPNLFYLHLLLVTGRMMHCNTDI